MSENKIIISVFVIFVIIVSFWKFIFTDAGWSKMTSLGNEHSVQLYSGGELVREWVSTGKPFSEENSDGYSFKDKISGNLTEVSGNVVIIMLSE